MAEVVVTMDDVTAASAEVALAECESARRAMRLSEECQNEAAALVGDPELAAEWARASRLHAGLAFGHYLRANVASPGSPAARQAKDYAAMAAGHAHAAELVSRRD